MLYQLGTAKIDITPQHAIPLAGFSVRNDLPFERIASRIYARIAYFRQVENDGTHRQALVVSADLIWWGSDRMPVILEKLKQHWGLDPAHVILHGTHSHSGPQTSSVFHPLLGSMDADYVSWLEQQLMEGVSEAVNNCEPVKLERGEADLHCGIYRRPLPPNETGPVDPEVTVIRFINNNEHTKALFVHYTCHPVTTADPYVSAEFTGVAMNKVEEKLDGAVSLFLQGCCGDTNIDLSPFNLPAAGKRGNEEHVEYFGNQLAQTVLEVMNKPMRQLEPTPLQGTSYTLPLKLQEPFTQSELLRMAQEEKEPKKWWAQTALKNPDPSDSIHIEMSRLDFAEEFSMLTFNAEVVAEYGLFVKQCSDHRILPVPYSNGMFGYVPTGRQIVEGGYEPNESSYYFNMPGRLDESIEGALKAKLEHIITQE